MNNRRQFILGTAGALAAASSPLTSLAQAGGTHRIVVGFAPGGSNDVMARLLVQRLQEAGESWIVENKSGAAGRLSIMDVRNAPADGRSLLLTPDPMMTVYPLVYRRLGYSPSQDFRPLTPIATVPMGLAVGPLVPASVRTVDDFVRWCKAHPEQASYGTAGAGTTLHFIGTMLGRAGGFNYAHVPYRGGQPAAQDVLAGQIASSINVISELVPLVPSGKLRVLAVSSAQRSPQLPDVPTFTQSGYKSLESLAWFGLFLPARTPDDIADRLHARIVQAAQSRELQAGLQKLGYDVATRDQAAFASLLRSDIARWEPVVRETGYVADE